MIIFYIFAGLAFLSIFLLFILSLILFNRIHSCMSAAEKVKQFYYETSQNTKDLEEKVLQFKKIAESTKYSQEELEKTFESLQETALTLQSAYEAKKTVLNLMRR